MPFENWEGDNKPSPAKIAAIFLIAVIATSATVYGIYKIVSPTVETYSSEPAKLSIVVNATAYFDAGTYTYPNVTVGDTLVLKSQLNDALAGEEINFYVNNQLIGFDNTDDTGTATYSYTVTQPGKLTFHTECYHS